MDQKRQFIFIHAEKTGGTSIARAIWGYDRGARQQSQTNDYDNGMTKHYSVDKARRIYGDWRWRRYFKFTVVRNPWDRLVSKWWWRHDGTNEEERAEHHLQLDENGCISRQWFEKEFAEEQKRWELETTFDEFLFGKEGHECPQVDYVLRFENLQKDWLALLLKGAIKWSGCKKTLPRTNISTQRDSDYRIYYTDETRDMVAKWCAKHISYFHYEF